MRQIKYGIAISILLVLLLLTACQPKDTGNSGEEELITGEVIQITPDYKEDKETITDNITDITKFSSNMLRVEKIEGNLIRLQPDAYDPDGDKIIYTFTKPFDNDGEWQTVEGDAGEYVITITASDGKLSTSEDILVIVKPTNKAPIIECPDKLSFKETNTVEINCTVTDPEGKEVIVTYSGWMNSVEKKTTYDDAGKYDVTITAKDGEKTTIKNLKIIIENVNRPPKVEDIKDITVQETETINVNVTTSDLDKDKITVEYSEPLGETGVWKTKYGDAGTYETYVLVSDGQAVVKKEFTIVVKQKNTAPSLEFIENITIDEGETIELPINAFDREGDEITVKITGWFKTETYTTSYEDEGEHNVTVIVSDGELSTSQKVKITVNDMNRAPIFKIAA